MLPRDAIFDISLFIFVTYVVKHVASISYVCCPTPHGVGGLKSVALGVGHNFTVSHPARGGWIEIEYKHTTYHKNRVPPRTGWVD